MGVIQKIKKEVKEWREAIAIVHAHDTIKAHRAGIASNKASMLSLATAKKQTKDKSVKKQLDKEIAKSSTNIARLKVNIIKEQAWIRQSEKREREWKRRIKPSGKR